MVVVYISILVLGLVFWASIFLLKIKEDIATIKDLRDTKTDTRSILIEKNPRVIKNVLEKERWG